MSWLASKAIVIGYVGAWLSWISVFNAGAVPQMEYCGDWSCGGWSCHRQPQLVLNLCYDACDTNPHYKLLKRSDFFLALMGRGTDTGGSPVTGEGRCWQIGYVIRAS